jgi:Helix-turn-helix domain
LQDSSLSGTARCNCENRNMNEEFRTVAQVAEMLGVSRDTVRRLFADEPGIIDLGRHETAQGRRRYRLLRIPDSVLDRVLNRKSVK